MTDTKTLPSEELLASLGTVGAAMTADVVSLPPDMPAMEAVAVLERAGVTGGPVVEHEQVIGVITLRDLVQRPMAQATGPWLRPPRGQADWAVRDLMTRGVVAARTHWPLLEAVVLMDEARVNRLPVVDDAGRAVGILARDDVIRALARVARAGERTVHVEFRSMIRPD